MLRDRHPARRVHASTQLPSALHASRSRQLPTHPQQAEGLQCECVAAEGLWQRACAA